jgi:hypothetical protein
MGGYGKGMKGKAVDQKTQMHMQMMMRSMMDQQGASDGATMPAPTRQARVRVRS